MSVVSPFSSNASPPSPPTDSQPTDAQSDLTPSALTPQSHLYRVQPVTLDPSMTEGATPASAESDSASPVISEPVFSPGARAVDDVDHQHAPVDPPSRIRAQPQVGGLYSQQKPVSRIRPKHDHSADEDKPITDDDALTQSQPPAAAEPCLTAEQLAAAKKEVRARLLGVMDQYLAVWQAEEKTDDEIEQLYTVKKDELKTKLADKKQRLTSRACPDVPVDGGNGRRRLMGLEDDDWFDQGR